MKTKENCFNNFNDARVILNKKTNLKVMYVRDFRASIPVCKDLVIKTQKILAILLILFLRVFRPFGLSTLCHHTTKFSSLGISVLLSYQRESPEGALWKGVLSYKFHKIHRKSPVSESLFLLKRLWRRCFPVNFVKMLRTRFLQNTSSGYFCLIYKHWNK